MRTFVFFLALVMSGMAWAAEEKPQAIVVFLADDLGYNDTSAYGCEKAPCPHLNRLAEEGLRFTDAHSTNSVCTPSRFSLLTGKYAWRQKNTGILPGDAKLILPTKEQAATLGSLMQQAGYRTAAIGKWHLGLGSGKEPTDWNKPIAPGPREVGFDYSFIMAATADRVPCVYVQNGEVVGLDPADPIRVSYQKGFRFTEEQTGAEHPELLKPWGRPSNKQHADTIIDGISRIGHMTGGKAALWKDQDLADDITRAAVNFIRESRGQRIFLYFCTNDIHVPRDPHQRFRDKSGLGIRGDVTVQMDDSLGQIRQALAENGYENSLIIFTSDNGPVISDGYEDGAAEACKGHNPAAPYSGGKYGLLEGGTRIPFIVHWPGHVKAGSTSSALICQMDLGRTLAELVGVPVPAGSMQDSEALLPALLGQSPTGRSELVEAGNSGSARALRSGNLKLIATRWPKLYDLSSDVAEQHDLAKERPEQTRELLDRLKAIEQAPAHP